MIFSPNLSILPPQLLRLWPELDTMPETFTLYAGRYKTSLTWK